MTKINQHPNKNLIHVQVLEPLSFQLIDELRNAMDEYFNAYDKAPALVIESTYGPHWESVAALKNHLTLIKNKHQLIRKVALVGDALGLKVLPALMDHFVGAKLRHFPLENSIAALEWAASEEDHPGAFEVLKGLPRDVIAIKVKGIITSQDYKNTLVPLVEKMVNEHEKVKLYCVIGNDFDRYSASAVWDDARLGLAHMFDFSKVAFVTDIGWMAQGVKLLGPLMPTEVMVFPSAQDSAAREWIKG